MRNGTGAFPRSSPASTARPEARRSLVTVLQNRWEAATLHWACQFAGIIITPINWRAKADEIDYCVENAEAKALVYQDVSAEAVAGLARSAEHRARIAVGIAPQASEIAFERAQRIVAPRRRAARRAPTPGR